MNARRCEFFKKAASAPSFAALVAAGVCLAGGAFADTPGRPAVPPEVITAAEQSAPYPTFASIPAPPRDVPSAAQWKALVVDTRQQGARLTRQVNALQWDLTDISAWEARVRDEVVAPPQLTDTSPNVDAIAADLRARASAPPRSR